jgi:hypothetical protein
VHRRQLARGVGELQVGQQPTLPAQRRTRPCASRSSSRSQVRIW